MIVESLQLLLGFEFDKEELKKFDESVNTINNSLKALGAVVLTSTGAITAMTLSSSRSAVDMLKLSSATGTAIENLEALEYVSTQNSIQSNTLSGALESVRNNITNMSKGSGSALEAFSMLGISVFGADGKLRDSYETMKEATEKLSKMTDATQQADYAQQIFGGSASEMMFMIRKGSQAFKDGEIAMRKYGSTLSRDQLENVAKFSQTWDTLKNSFSQFTDIVWSQLAPAMNNLIKGLLEWWDINRKVITANAIKYYKAFANIILTIIKYFWEFVKVLSRVVDDLGGFERVLKLVFWAFTSIMAMKFLTFLGTVATMALTVGNALMAMNLKAMLLPVLIGVAVTLAILAIQDFYVFLKGGKSTIGELLGSWSEPVRNFADAYIDTIQDIIDFWTGDFIGEFKKAGNAIILWGGVFFNKLKNWFNSIVSWIEHRATEIYDAITKPFKEAFDYVSNTYGLDGISKAFDGFKMLIGMDGSQQVPIGQTSDNRVTSTVFNNNPNISVNTNNGGVASRIIQDANQFEYGVALQQYNKDVQ